jgi:hypothetical protein
VPMFITISTTSRVTILAMAATWIVWLTRRGGDSRVRV